MTSFNQSNISFGSGQVLKPTWPAQRVTLSEVSRQWQIPTKQRLEELIRLEEGWDGYSGFPVSFTNAMFAFRMLESICRPDTAAPQIVPGPSGDLQIEWHTNHGAIELWVLSPNNVHAWRSMTKAQNDEEIDLTTDFSIVASWVKEIMEPTIAVATAA